MTTTESKTQWQYRGLSSNRAETYAKHETLS
jgi:hypothetical protein